MGSFLKGLLDNFNGGMTTFLKPAHSSGLSKITAPLYKTFKPTGERLERIFTKATDTGEHFVTGGLDFTDRFISKARGGVLNLEDGALNLTSLLKNPMVLIGGGILVLVVVSKI